MGGVGAVAAGTTWEGATQDRVGAPLPPPSDALTLPSPRGRGAPAGPHGYQGSSWRAGGGGAGGAPLGRVRLTPQIPVRQDPSSLGSNTHPPGHEWPRADLS